MIQVLLLLLLAFLAPNHQINGQFAVPKDTPSMADVNTSWQMDIGPMLVLGTKRFQPILSNHSQHENDPLFSCGFICNYVVGLGFECVFGILIFPNRSTINDHQLVWSANRNNPISTSGTLKLVEDGDLILTDANGRSVWATSTGGKFIKGLKLSENGNLVLFDHNISRIIWQSFDYPTDTLLPGQILLSDQNKLVSNNSTIDLGDGLYSMFVQKNRLVAQFSSNHDNYTYYTNQDVVRIDVLSRAYFEYLYTTPTNARFIRLEVDGHLRSYEWRSQTGNNWVVDDDVFSTTIGACDYPMVCGRYGICSAGQCSCPKVEKLRFHSISERRPNLGCGFDHSPGVGCQPSRYYYNELVEIKNVTYFDVKTMSSNKMNLLACRTSCLKNCSCKSMLFRTKVSEKLFDAVEGDCFLLSEVFTLMNMEQEEFNSTFFVKVQVPKRKTNKWRLVVILSTSIGSILGGLVIVIIWVIQYRKKTRSELEADECFINQVKGIPSRFSFEQLRLATDDFKRKIGEGGFGTVFEGILSNGTRVAVKRLNTLDLTERTFLAEVQTIGSIHHVNLVRLVGFCLEKSHRLLVYEFMSNGSLNEWIFPKKQAVSLQWEMRRKIVIDVAKGLAYLHGECRQKIFHLDIKPQNILLDENLDAKVSDFGLSKLIDKDQSKVVTTMKGTPGYMAPEWLSSIITEKVDVYSFGVVVLEVLCGRKNVDFFQNEEDIYLLSVFKRKAEKGQLLDLVDKNSENMQINGREVVEMMKVAAWCLQVDYEKRPSMTMVVQVLEGSANVEDLIPCNFDNQIVQSKSKVASDSLLEPVYLSGPR